VRLLLLLLLLLPLVELFMLALFAMLPGVLLPLLNRSWRDCC
jgi:hypothetical protein